MASCTGKPKFSTEAEARKALKHTVPGLNTVYACQACGKYHLGSVPQPKVRPRKMRKAAHYARR
jgi:hypothetical protein